jgi:hypothetical protein
MSGVYSTNGGNEKLKKLLDNLKGRDYIGVDGRIILK